MFLTSQENWPGFKTILERAGSKLAATNEDIKSTGAVWQNKIAQAHIVVLLSDQNQEVEKEILFGQFSEPANFV